MNEKCTFTGVAAMVKPEIKPPTTRPSAPDKVTVIIPDLPDLGSGVSVGVKDPENERISKIPWKCIVIVTLTFTSSNHNNRVMKALQIMRGSREWKFFNAVIFSQCDQITPRFGVFYKKWFENHKKNHP
ncbi:hypothetical protein CASFOL_005875 [Castilleja foliolosa]|uniref:Uncharacterized protein n=1 Tax=Castilleja foliolosa TaxID=1961234 RepID=A0ABD3E5R1_9LAMI